MFPNFPVACMLFQRRGGISTVRPWVIGGCAGFSGGRAMRVPTWCGFTRLRRIHGRPRTRSIPTIDVSGDIVEL
ncbi:MAG: hypothetical protein FWH20_08850 [Oscillospiraceae bacterium]|nr:hypothetical protein [Oscillospiraceae bacterium]